MIQWIASFAEHWQTFRGWAGKGVAEILAGAVFFIVSVALKKIYNWCAAIWKYFQRMQRIKADVGRETSDTWPRESSGLWVAKPICKPKIPGYDHNTPPAKILVIANAKGGVGKTTVAACLGGRFAELAAANGGKPVLLIDLDFQGSLSSMCFIDRDDWLPGKHRDSEATYLLSGDRDGNDVASYCKLAMVDKAGQSVAVPKLKVITSYYDLAQAENRLMVEWLVSDRSKDLRMHLAELLHSNGVREAYSLIIIDCPPRLTTGAIQALAAGTHLLVPTILDNPSAEAVVTFARQVETFRRAKLCPNIEYVGVVGTVVDGRQNLEPQRLNLTDRLGLNWDDGGVDAKIGLLPIETEIPDNTVFRDAAGRGNPYLTMGSAQNVMATKEAVQALAARVAIEMNLPQNLRG